MHRKIFILFTVTVLGLLFGCAKEMPTETEPPVRPVKTLVIAGDQAGGTRSFPARIEAAQRAELSFRVSGTVQKLPIKEGDRLQEGDLVAQLDPKDYQIIVNDRQATFDKARKNYKRGQELVSSGTISRVDFDSLEAEFKNAQAALQAAKQDLAYTQLKAPFDGMIAKRLVERFEEVQAKQPVVAIQNIEMLEVKFDVPEAIIRGLRRAGNEGGTEVANRVQVYATFEGRSDRTYPLEFKEISTKADEKTQTFGATYLMRQWEQGVVLPGMTATVTVDFGGTLGADIVHTVPVTAVVGDYKLDPRVWVVDEASMTVAPRPVKVGRMVGDGIVVREGLEPGMRVVTAGTPFLVKGMKVRLMPEREQAESRPEDLKYQ